MAPISVLLAVQQLCNLGQTQLWGEAAQSHFGVMLIVGPHALRSAALNWTTFVSLAFSELAARL
jgi:hypothetical protein